MKELENAQIQMRKGILEFCILQIVAEGEIYATELISRLREAEMLVVEGTVYPLLNRLLRADLLEHVWVESLGGPPRKYYTLTDKGSSVLQGMRQTWDGLQKSVSKIIADSNFYSTNKQA
ncbi:MAG: PadR family transcriptional regulator [Bernardetiaceae bacterium]|nr:PadR family transcriptional regulator [Bernardetiaceae bacterium]